MALHLLFRQGQMLKSHSWCIRKHMYNINQRRRWVACAYSTQGTSDSDDENNDVLSSAEEDNLKRKVGDSYLTPFLGHNVLVLLPDMKRINKAANTITTLENQLDEACALVHCLPRWKVVGSTIRVINSRRSPQMFGSGAFVEVQEFITQQKNVSAVFVSVDILMAIQLSTFQKAWKLPVYDRYTMVLQIFKVRAQTREAKLQVALAEIPYYRSRMTGVTMGELNVQKSDTSVFTSSGQTFIDTRKRILGEREQKIRRALEKIKTNREVLRQGRKRSGYPVIAVVGYTNAGKTSLIKALTSDDKMVPKDQLFATLDVTMHAGRLCNNMKVLYVDTVGFISDIPTGLVASFSATLEDVLNADLIVHVRDISHPDRVAQKKHVLTTLDRLHLPSHLQENILEVANKADKLSREEATEMSDDGCIAISATTGQGLNILMKEIEKLVLNTTGRLSKRFRIPMNSPHLAWLHKHAVVESTTPCDQDSEKLLVDVVITTADYAKFLNNFGAPKISKVQGSDKSERDKDEVD